MRRDEVLIETLRNEEGLLLEVLGTHIKRVESEDHLKVIWYVWGENRKEWYFSSNTWQFEAIFQAGQDHS